MGKIGGQERCTQILSGNNVKRKAFRLTWEDTTSSYTEMALLK
jgi:hypothetical protein